jgi:hypothetical protein
VQPFYTSASSNPPPPYHPPKPNSTAKPTPEKPPYTSAASSTNSVSHSTIHADNNGAIQMSNAHQPTKRTRHVAIKSFAILQWTEEDLIKYEKIASAINPSDSLTKMTGRYKFYEHFDILMGYRRPDYALADPHTAHISSCSAYNLFHLVEDESHL